MATQIEHLTPDGVMTPIGPYSHIAKHGNFIMISAIAGVDPGTNELAGPDIESQTAQILDSFRLLLATAGSDFQHVLHVNVFLVDMNEFAAMNEIYAEKLGACRPARSAIAVTALPKPGARVTMNLTAVTRQNE